MLFVRKLEPWEERQLSNIEKRDARYIRAQYVLLSANGYSVPEIAVRTGKHSKTIRKWIKLFNSTGMDGLRKVIPRKVPYERKTNRRSLVSLVNDVRRSQGISESWAVSWDQLQSWNARRASQTFTGTLANDLTGGPSPPPGPMPNDSPFQSATGEVREAFADWDSLVNWSNRWGGEARDRTFAPGSLFEDPAPQNNRWKVDWAELVSWNVRNARPAN